MRDDDSLDPVERMERDEYENAIGELIGEYLARRDRCRLVRVDDLAAAAAALGPVAVGALRFAIHFCETHTPDEPGAAS